MDKIWNFNLNQIPDSQSSIQSQSESFIFQLKNNLKLNGWGVTYSYGCHGRLPVGMSYCSSVLLQDGRIFLIQVGATTNTYFGTFVGDTISWTSGSPLPFSSSATNIEISQLSDGRLMLHDNTYVLNYSALVYFGSIYDQNSITWTAGTYTAYPGSSTLEGSVSRFNNIQLTDNRILRLGNVVLGTSKVGLVFSPRNTIYFSTVSGNTLTTTLSSSTIPETPSGSISSVKLTYTIQINSTQILYFVNYNVYIGTISGTTISWGAATPLGFDVGLASAPVLLTNNSVYISAISADYLTTYPYFITVSNNSISIVLASSGAYSITKYYTCSNLIANNTLFFIGGLNGNIKSSGVHGYAINNQTLTASGISSNDAIQSYSDFGHDSSSFIILSSPIGFVAGSDGSYSGTQSQIYMYLSAIGNSLSDITISLVKNLSDITFNGYGAALSNKISSISTIIPSTLSTLVFHYAFTAKGGFWTGVSGIASNELYSLTTLLDLADVQKLGANDYPFALHFSTAYTTTMNYQYFDSSVNTNAKTINSNWTVGTNSALVWHSPGTTTYIPGTGTTISGDINGNILTSQIYVYKNQSGKVAMIGRIPDFKASGSTGLTQGSVTPSLLNATHTTIDQLWIPANTGLQL